MADVLVDDGDSDRDTKYSDRGTEIEEQDQESRRDCFGFDWRGRTEDGTG